MITPEVIIACALRHPTVMDQLGDALRSDIVIANTFQRRIAEFADTFLVQRRKLPSDGDWEAWLVGLAEGNEREGIKENLGRLLSIDVSSFDPGFFAEQVIGDLQATAADVARSRLNSAPVVTPQLIAELAEKVASVRSGSLQGLARLRDIDVWAQPVREDELIKTGFSTLDRLIGGWGKELWIAFADSNVGKSMLLQNFASNMAVRGKNVLHVSLELGIRPQIHRYYRQLTEMSREEFNEDQERLKKRLRHWFRLAKGSIYLLEFPALTLDPETLHRTIERVMRATGVQIDALVLDYLDLMAPSKRSSRGAYEDLGRLTHEVRGLCPSFDMSVLTVSQAVRRPEKAGRLSLRDMGDSYGKVRGADGLLSLVQTEEEEEAYQGRLGILKTRDSGGRGQEIPLYINRELSIIQELDHPNTVRLMKQLGQLPKPAANVALRGARVGAR